MAKFKYDDDDDDDWDAAAYDTKVYQNHRVTTWLTDSGKYIDPDKYLHTIALIRKYRFKKLGWIKKERRTVSEVMDILLENARRRKSRSGKNCVYTLAVYQLFQCALEGSMPFMDRILLWLDCVVDIAREDILADLEIRPTDCMLRDHVLCEKACSVLAFLDKTFDTVWGTDRHRLFHRSTTAGKRKRTVKTNDDDDTQKKRRRRRRDSDDYDRHDGNYRRRRKKRRR